MDIYIRMALPSDWEEIKRIYQQGIDTNLATLVTDCPEWEEWDNSHLETCRFVYVLNDKVSGWVALTPVSDCCVFTGVADISIYISEEAKRQGIGTALLKAVMEASEQNGIWTLQSGILQENTASLGLHKKCGFREIGYREKIAKDKFGVWRNIVLMERRSESDDFGCCGCSAKNDKGDFTMKKMQIFEPAMCCPTGLCGVGVDPELLRISTVLNSLKNNGIKVDRFNLNSAPMEFVNNKIVNEYINRKGPEGLPVVTVDGEILIEGRYPTNEEFTKIFDLPEELLAKPLKSGVKVKVTPKKADDCGFKGGCC